MKQRLHFDIGLMQICPSGCSAGEEVFARLRRTGAIGQFGTFTYAAWNVDNIVWYRNEARFSFQCSITARDSKSRCQSGEN
jgi:hypothetical protein